MHLPQHAAAAAAIAAAMQMHSSTPLWCRDQQNSTCMHCIHYRPWLTVEGRVLQLQLLPSLLPMHVDSRELHGAVPCRAQRLLLLSGSAAGVAAAACVLTLLLSPLT